MSDSKEHAGFSFQLSETPPPTENVGTPLGDLDLDLGDFVDDRHRSVARLKMDDDRGDGRAWKILSDPAPLVDAEPTEAVRPTPKEPTLREPAQHAAPVQGVVPAHTDAPSPPAPRVASKKSSREELKPPTTTPQIKKIQFPAARKAASATSSQDPERPSAQPKTRFSKSISNNSPRARLDSDPDFATNEENKKLREKTTQATPEDLPGHDEAQPYTAPAPTWSSETPSAKEIWQKARATWGATSRQALVLGGQSLRASKQLAETVNEKMKQKLQAAAQRRQEALERDATSPAMDEVQDEESVPSQTPKAGRAPGASVVGKIILGLARGAGKKAVAPLSAIAAAGMVYLVGSQLVGTEESVALSKTTNSPEIPELGTLPSKEKNLISPHKADGDGGPEHAGTEAVPGNKSTEPAAMQTEVTAMPEGLSWPGKGLIEVVTSAEELVYVDGVFTGRGPLRRIPVSPGEHEVSIRADGQERNGKVQVTANRNTRAVFSGE